MAEFFAGFGGQLTPDYPSTQSGVYGGQVTFSPSASQFAGFPDNPAEIERYLNEVQGPGRVGRNG